MVRATNSPTRLLSAEAGSVDVQPGALNSSASGAFPPTIKLPSSPQNQQQQQQQQAFQEEVRRELQAHARKLLQVEESIKSDVRAQIATMSESVMSKQREFANRMQEIVAAEEIVTEQVRARSAVVADLEVRMIDMAISISALRGDLERLSTGQSGTIAMSTLQEDAEQEFLARLDEVLEREAAARQQLEQKISARLNAVMVELVGRMSVQTSSLASLVNRPASGGQEDSAVDEIQSGNFQFQCRLMEQQVSTLCAAVSTLFDRCPEEAAAAALPRRLARRQCRLRARRAWRCWSGDFR